jgi:hypothetical protein
MEVPLYPEKSNSAIPSLAEHLEKAKIMRRFEMKLRKEKL